MASWPLTARAQEPGNAEPAPVEVVVRGPLLRGSASAPTSAVSVVTADALERPGVDAAEALRTVPGVQVARSGASSDYATASIRGATSAQTPVYLAGIRLNDDVGGSADLSAMPVWMLHRIEVFRGNAPEHADRLGLGGAIFLYPKLPLTDSATATAEFGSFGQRALSATATTGDGGTGVLLGARASHADNDYRFDNDGGTRFDTRDDREVPLENADYDDLDLWTISRHTVGRARIQTLFNAYAREQGVHGVGLSPAAATRARQSRMLGGVSAQTPCSADGSCRLELSTQALVSSTLTTDPMREIAALLAPELSVAGERVAQRARVEKRLSKRLRLAPSLWVASESLRMTRGLRDRVTAQRRTLRGALETRHETSPWLELHALGAGECHVTLAGNDDSDCTVLEPTGRAGFLARAHSSLDVLGNVGRYVRVPTLGEQFGTSPLVRGNDDLKPETGVSADLGVRANGQLGVVRLATESFGFYRSSRELISFRRSSLGIVRPFNVGRATALGAEIVGVADVPHVKLEGALTALDARDRSPDRTTTNDVLPLHARLVFHGRAELWSEVTALQLDRAHVGVSYSRRASRFVDPAGLIVLPAQRTVDLDAGAQLLRKRLAVRFAVRNLLDEHHVDILGAPLAGRSFHAALSGQLPGKKSR